jgi:hypothetical protein
LAGPRPLEGCKRFRTIQQTHEPTQGVERIHLDASGSRARLRRGHDEIRDHGRVQIERRCYAETGDAGLGDPARREHIARDDHLVSGAVGVNLLTERDVLAALQDEAHQRL